MRRQPGAVVLHDFVLHHLVAGVTIGRRDGHGYLDAMEREHGVVGRLLAHGVLDKRLPPLWEARPEEFPLAGEVLSLATGLVVHSRYVADRARAARFDGPIAHVPHPAWPDPGVEPAAIAGDPLIGAFGNVNQSKRVPQLLEAFARVRAEHPGARLLLVGATSPGFDLERRLQRLGLGGDGIVREGYVDERRLWELMAACHVHVSLRSPTMGETSGTAIRALTLGKPLVVSDVGWFAELPGRRRAPGCRRRRRGDRPRGGAAAPRRAARRARLDGRRRPRARHVGARSPSCCRPTGVGVRADRGRRGRRGRRRSRRERGGGRGRHRARLARGLRDRETARRGRPRWMSRGGRVSPACPIGRGSPGSSSPRRRCASGSSALCRRRSSSSTSSSTPSSRRASPMPAALLSAACRRAGTAPSIRSSSRRRTRSSTRCRAPTRSRRRRTPSRCRSRPCPPGSSPGGSRVVAYRSFAP